MAKKPSYVDLLKEQIMLREYDVKDFGYKGPMTEPIISYDGEGEMETNQTISDLLDKYYLKERKDERIIEQGEGGEAGEDPERNEIVDGETPDKIADTMDDFEDEILEGEDDDEAFDPDDVNEALESAIIERLIKEMEEEVGPDKEIEPEKDEETKQAGTDFATETDIDKVLEELELALAEQDEEGGDENKDEEAKSAVEDGEDKKELDVDKEVKTEHHRGLGPISHQKVENLEESFKLFLEQLEDEIGKEAGEEDESKDEKKDEKKEKEEDVEAKEDEKKEEGVTEDFDFVFEDDEVDSKADEGGDEKDKDKKEEDVETKDEQSVAECKLKEALKFIFEEDEGGEEKKEDEAAEEDKKDEKKEGDDTELTSEMIDLMLEELDLSDEDIDKW